MPAQTQAVPQYYSNTVVSYKAKCPTKKQYWANLLVKEMETVVRRNLKFVLYTRKSQEELAQPSANV